VKVQLQIEARKRRLLDIDEFRIEKGKINLLLGESGIGKTLISRVLFGLIPVRDLDININDKPYTAYLQDQIFTTIRKEGFFVFQEPSSHLNPMRSIGEQLDEGSLSGTDLKQSILSQLFPVFNHEELEKFLDVFPKPYRPSGGEKQRLLIAMAFRKMSLLDQKSENNEALFIFDEPTGNLDNAYRNLFLKMLLEAHGRFSFTVLLITHDYSMISELTNRYASMQDKIRYWELRRSKNILSQVSFDVRSYLNWLKEIKTVPVRTGKTDRPLLTLDHEVQVFNRQLSVSSDPAFKRLTSLTIYPGDVVYLKAASGVGKTTVAKIMMGLQKAGRVHLQIDGLMINERTAVSFWRKKIWAKKMGMVFQHADEALNLNGRVKDIFRGLPLKQRRDRSFLTRQLELVFSGQVDDAFLDQPVAFLSGGQKQRLNLLRALILDTDLLILDEPFNGLDFFTLQKILDLIQKRQKEGKSFLLISHNEEIIERLVPAERIYHLTWQRL